jgi:hypothetical protein
MEAWIHIIPLVIRLGQQRKCTNNLILTPPKDTQLTQVRVVISKIVKGESFFLCDWIGFLF